MQGLIPSLAPFHSVFVHLCQQAPQGTWHGDIFALRRAFGDTQLSGYNVTKRLASLQNRGMLTFTVEKPRHKQCLWTVTIQNNSTRSFKTV